MTEQTHQRRPTFLLVICILSLVWTGYAFLYGVLNLSVGPLTKTEMNKWLAQIDQQMHDLETNNLESWKPTFQKIRQMKIESNRKFYPIQITNVLIIVVGIFGVVWMLRGLKIGFHLYIIYSLLDLMQHYFFLSPTIIPTFLVVLNLIVTGLFIAMYAANLKSLR